MQIMFGFYFDSCSGCHKTARTQFGTDMSISEQSVTMKVNETRKGKIGETQ